EIEVGRHVSVIGGGNTAVDISIQMKRLGAEFVTLVYRRGREQMSATSHEQELAQSNGVLIKPWAKPTKIFSENGKVSCVEFEYTEMRSGGKLAGTGKTFTLNADQVFKAIGQSLETGSVTGKLFPETVGGKIQVNADFETTIPRVYAGGDCVGPGEDLTVTSVQQGKLAALSIHKKFGGKAHG
ncbi:MAG: FAD-dependent oxidoreductase, partial [Bdellovibrionota bacterium]